MTSFDLIAHIAGLFVAISLIPQVTKSWKTKSTKDISLLWTSTLSFGLILWLMWGAINQIIPIIIFVTIELLLSLSLIVLKLKHK